MLGPTPWGKILENLKRIVLATKKISDWERIQIGIPSVL